MKVAYYTNRVCHHQSGAVLVISLLMLLLLTLIGVSGSEMTSLEQKMASNAQDENIAFNAAELAMKEAIDRVNSAAGAAQLPMRFSAEGTDGFYLVQNSALSAANASTDAFWLNNPSIAYSGAPIMGVNPAYPPRYVIQYLGVLPPPHIPEALNGRCVYNIFVRATGGTSNSPVVLQAMIITRQQTASVWLCDNQRAN